MRIASTADFREAARRRVPRFLFDYADGGSGTEDTMLSNSADLRKVALRQRVLKDVASIDLSTEILGQKQDLPVALGPVGISGMFARRGEVQAASSASKAGVPACLSTVSICSIEEVVAATERFWFQLYVIRDRSVMLDIIERAKVAGAKALVFTVDMPVPGSRARDVHSGMSGPNAGIRRIMQAVGKPAWSVDVGLLGRPHTLGNLVAALGKGAGINDYMGWLGKNFDPSIQWKDLEWIRSAWDGPLIIKGILDPEDAREAVALGADGIVVSNHGGRQLNGALSTAHALPAIAEAVGDQITVLADGGVRSGLDVVRLLALGADGVLLGRLWLYALAAGGSAGVTQMFDFLKQDMKVTMTLAGVNSISKIDRSILVD